MAIDPITDNLLGVAINVEAKRDKKEQTLEECLEEYENPKFKHIMTVLYNGLKLVVLFLTNFRITKD